MSRHARKSSTAARFVVALALLTSLAGAASAGEQKQAAAAAPAASPPSPAAVQPAALHACSQRADLLFVRKCLQACMIDSKTNTRVMQQSREREECQLRCGHQPEMASFVQACLERAARVAAAPAAVR
ncbi:hypothetical protein [Anaeromyxobacter oryzae]|uniref:Uncharacterized protein n=1 Tax=Anaeromyxobacter oryzae TaxID=2918170 RepID=A0ABM7WPL1_9BACT|nr:hypothetical protein [Anaeromyxobacter oryzae]BDG01396.1 hypothetical protein AMOR_03920 [Anaeromyxobacter oryzae]